MQTLHLRLRALRAISPGQSPSRWQTPSMRSTSKWEGARPLPNLPRPTSAVGSQSSAGGAGPKDVPRLFVGSARSTAKRSPGAFPGSCLTPLRPSSALGSRPTSTPGTPGPTHPDGIPCPVAGAGLPRVSRLRAARKDSRWPVFPYRVCPRQTASELSPDPAPQEAGDLGADHWQARASVARWAASLGLSLSDRPQPHGGRSSPAKTAGLRCGGSGPLTSRTAVLRPTGRLRPVIQTRETEPALPPYCVSTLLLSRAKSRTARRCLV